MGDVGVFFAMGGYAAFVWPAYGLALVVLGGLAVQAWGRYRASTVALEQLQQASRKRR